MHSLFSLPSNSSEQLELLGKLGFFETYTPIHKDRVGILIYNFNVQKVIKYNNQIVISGIPSRTGAEIISIDTSPLVNKKGYLVQLVTLDDNEVDYDILVTE